MDMCIGGECGGAAEEGNSSAVSISDNSRLVIGSLNRARSSIKDRHELDGLTYMVLMLTWTNNYITTIEKDV